MDNQNSLVEQLAGFIGLPREVIIKAMTFGGSLLKEPLSEFSNIFVDDIRYLRVKNQVRILNKAQDYFEKKGISPKTIPAKTLVPLLEGCSLEEDDSLQKMWEALLINSANPANKNEFITGYSYILKQLTPQEGKLLDYIYTNYKSNEFTVGLLLHERIIETSYFIQLYIDNFVRMNLIKNILPELLHRELEDSERERSFNNAIIFPTDRYWSIERDAYILTNLGMNFIENCKIKEL